jgi:hypothetical protein
MDRNIKDALFLAYAKRLGYVFDPQNGTITRNGKLIGCTNRRSVTINFSLPDKTLTGISRARAIWLHVYGHVPADKELSHISSNLMDDSISNLELVTRADRQRKIIANGKGKLNSRASAKLDLEKVNDLRRLSRTGWSLNKMAKKFGVSKITVLFAVNGTTWKDATEPPNLLMKERSHVIFLKNTNVTKKVVSKYEQHDKIVKSLLMNNNRLSNDSLMRFLKMRGLEITVWSLQKMTKKIKAELSAITQAKAA